MDVVAWDADHGVGRDADAAELAFADGAAEEEGHRRVHADGFVEDAHERVHPKSDVSVPPILSSSS